MLKRTSTALMLIACLALAACGGDTSSDASSQETQKEQDPAEFLLNEQFPLYPAFAGERNLY